MGWGGFQEQRVVNEGMLQAGTTEAGWRTWKVTWMGTSSDEGLERASRVSDHESPSI